MSCFDGVVGIKNACIKEGDLLLQSSSGLWLQNLKGFPGLKIADASINEEYESGIDLIRECLNTAIKELSTQFRTHIDSKLELSSIVDDSTVGIFKENKTVKPVQTGYWVGVRTEIRRKTHFEFVISEISLLLNADETADVKIFNLNTGEEIESIELETSAGIPASKIINKSLIKDGQRLDVFIGYLSTAPSLNTTIPGCNTCRQSGELRFTPVKILDSDPKKSTFVKTANDTAGISFNYSLNCSADPLLCSSVNQFAWPLLHKWGSNVMAEAVYGRRLHSLINNPNDKELNNALYKEYENEYMASMSGVLNNMRMPDDICFKCRPRVRQVVRIP